MNSKQTVSHEEYRQWVGMLQDKQPAMACAAAIRFLPRRPVLYRTFPISFRDN